MLELGEVLMLAELLRSPDREGCFLWPDNVYKTDYSAFISKSSLPFVRVNRDISGLKVGLTAYFAHTTLFTNWLPNHENIFMYDTREETYNALIREDVDVIVNKSSALLQITHYGELSGYKVNYLFDNVVPSTFAFILNEELLCSIVDKTLEHIDTDFISNGWTGRVYDHSREIAQARFFYIAVIAGILFAMLVIIVSVAVHVNRLKVRNQKRLQDELGRLNLMTKATGIAL